MNRPEGPRLRLPRGLCVATVCALAIAAGAGCSRPGGPFEVTKSEFPVPDAGAPPIVTVVTPPKCLPIQSSDPLPARTTIAGGGQDGGLESQIYLTSDLYGLFKSVCGGCHIDAPQGGFAVTESTFTTVLTTNPNVYAAIISPDKAVYMPPFKAGGVPLTQRSPTDAVVQLATLLKTWLDQGGPAEQFIVANQNAAASTGYAMTSALGEQLTNIGSCVPEKAMVGANQSAMDKLDAFFASATELAPALDQTDLISLDSATLAQNGVVSYAPTYPLWSDNAGKMRYVRVPRGQAITLNKETQTFSIPPNTRFYKTFLKEVVDGNGNKRFRKIETRLIVSRPDTTAADGTTAVQNALFGTYVWNKDESQALLSNHPLRNGKPFADQIFPLITDDKKDNEIIATNPVSLPSAEAAAGIVRHYALPGSERCIQCHMGSPSAAFVLGFTPLQVARRPNGSGGVFESASGDELTQLQRLIDYGVIAGVKSPGDILPLESSQGSRAPRNQYELAAQAYMVGNCAHCHNERGYPSVRQPELKEVLDFLPGPGPHDGIFQFSLEKFSPVRYRGKYQNVPIPYITPSLYDYPSLDATGKTFCPSQPGGSCGDDPGAQFVLAPWRSLIFRNTDTPYDYFDDFVPFPHMPLDTSGYDCRVAALMSDWMVSIPSRLKNPQNAQAVFATTTGFPSYANTDPQPYEEALPTDSDYAAAVGGAGARLNQLHNIGFRYGFCPSTYTADIIDPTIADQVSQGFPVQSDLGVGFFSPSGQMIMPVLTPISPDYIAADNTDPAGDWFPRRPDWETTLVNPDIPTVIADATAAEGLQPDAAEDLTNVLTALQEVTLTDATRSALLQPYPFGLWDTTVAGCDFTKIPTVGSFSGVNRPQWMDVASPPPAPSAPVFVESSGAAVFTTICFNCHGINADSKGLLADEISSLTGGDARVANLRDGLLGPLDAPGTNRMRVFGDDASVLGLSSDDLASRYMAWMTLGGTLKHLPQDVLTEVSLTPVLGQIRQHIDAQGTPDMLRLGLQLCGEMASSDANGTEIPLSSFIGAGRIPWSDVTGLVDKNGDAEMWLRLCNLNNRQIVHVAIPSTGSWTATTAATGLKITGLNLFWGTAPSGSSATAPNGQDWYGANPVMDQKGNLHTGLSADNLYPLCVLKPSNATELQYATAALQAGLVHGQNAIPFCPDGLLTSSHQLLTTGTGAQVDYTDGRKWAARGAINGALAVFLYLDQIEKDPSKRQPLYTQCNLIGTGK